MAQATGGEGLATGVSHSFWLFVSPKIAPIADSTQLAKFLCPFFNPVTLPSE